MSVLGVVNSPLLAKRHFDEGEATEAGFDRVGFGGKRTRTAASPARCVPFVASGLGVHAVPPTTIAALLALFPGMDERAVTNVLAECGNNIDAAIKRLGELRLSVGNPAAANQQDAQPSTPPPASSQSAAAVAAAAAAAAAEAAEAGTPGGPTTAEQWVEVLVGEMSAARDLGDARTRAAGFLRQFEAFVARYVRQQQQGAGASTFGASPEPGAASATPAGASSSSASQSLAQRAAKLAEENALLKKAVQIQHRQLQEKSAAEGEVANLKAMLAQYQEQVRTLQMSNYSLSLHLQKATNSDPLGPHRNPDVF